MLAHPITLDRRVNTGATVTATATGQLTLHEVTRPVTFTISSRRNGSQFRAVGSIPISFRLGHPATDELRTIGSLATTA